MIKRVGGIKGEGIYGRKGHDQNKSMAEHRGPRSRVDLFGLPPPPSFCRQKRLGYIILDTAL